MGALVLFLLQFGQRHAQMFGVVSGGKDVIPLWSIALLAASELDGGGCGPQALRYLMAAGYGIPGITKLLLPWLEGHGVLAWLDGRTLQCILFERAVLFESDLAKTVAGVSVLVQLGSLAAVFFENAYFLLPVFPQVLALPLGIGGIGFHAGCTATLAINFLPMWLPTYACLLPPGCSAVASLQPQVDCAAWGLLTDAHRVPLGPLTCSASAVFIAGNLWYYAFLFVRRMSPEGKLWPFGITPFYSPYCTGYKRDATSGDLCIKAVVLKLVSPGEETAKIWQPPLDSYFSRRINAEVRGAGSVEDAKAANLTLLALAEAYAANQDSQVDLASCLLGRYRAVHWVERSFTLSWTNGFNVREDQVSLLSLEGAALEKNIRELSASTTGKRKEQ